MRVAGGACASVSERRPERGAVRGWPAERRELPCSMQIRDSGGIRMTKCLRAYMYNGSQTSPVHMSRCGFFFLRVFFSPPPVPVPRERAGRRGTRTALPYRVPAYGTPRGASPASRRVVFSAPRVRVTLTYQRARAHAGKDGSSSTSLCAAGAGTPATSVPLPACCSGVGPVAER